jgi:hypothetical protein
MQWRAALGAIFFVLLSEVSMGQHGRVCRAAPPITSVPEASGGRDRSLKEDTGQEVAIPVVVHIVYSHAQQDISDQQVYTQLQVLNEDFNRKNPDSVNTLAAFRPVAAGCKISFFLAREDASGTPATGVTRTLTTHGPFANDDIHYSATGGHDAWDTGKFLNIWVCDLADGVFGYGAPPGSHASVDGIVIDYRYFGVTNTPPYNKGRTATHEIGHWLGLKHLWGEAGGCVDDDGIEDTPPQSGASTGCDLARTGCGSLNMVQNYMDQSYDACMNLFTKGQRSVMRNNLFLYRSGVIRDKELVTGTSEEPYTPEVQFMDANTLRIAGMDPAGRLSIVDALGRTIPFTAHPDEGATIITLHGGVKGICILMLKQSGKRSVRRILMP